MTRDAHCSVDIAVAVRPMEILSSLALLFEIERHQTTLHKFRCPLYRMEDSPLIWMSNKKSRWALPFPRTGCTLNVRDAV